MSDYRDFCEAFGGSASDPDFMDNWLAEHCTETPPKQSDLQSKIESFDYESLLVKYKLTKEEMVQIKNYMIIYGSNNFNTQKMANNFITANNLWDEFPSIRSLNDHGSHKNIPGILPKFYRITCAVLEIVEGGGEKLTKATKY
ncbi:MULTISPECIES: hypothetical protein [Pseudomonas]|uniref:Uncharacterized protein n=1 Tax=Pseudomonas helleri TaxID=1608996 RepID=A0A7X1XJI4_9PSED|nr:MULTISPECIES: hypothetical protein [Pseudomonas]MBK3456713.1 hypothetical protein [Pseudomonas sp. MF6754]MQT92756.1 hypothetical protein [Pseudomonas helleri]